MKEKPIYNEDGEIVGVHRSYEITPNKEKIESSCVAGVLAKFSYEEEEDDN